MLSLHLKPARFALVRGARSRGKAPGYASLAAFVDEGRPAARRGVPRVRGLSLCAPLE